MKKLAEHAVLIGGSISGLLMGKVLSDYFERVTILEKDGEWETRANRKGVPQENQTHMLQVKGLNILESFFPGMFKQLVASGSIEIEYASQLEIFRDGDWKMDKCSGIKALCQSRNHLEREIEKEIRKIGNVYFLNHVDVKGLLFDKNKKRVTGAFYQEEGTSEHKIISSDLIIDTSGRKSQLTTYLNTLGFPRPKETEIKVGLTYGTRIFENLKQGPKKKSIFILPNLKLGTRGALLCPIEGDRWTLTLGAMAGDKIPRDEAGYLEYAKSLNSSVIYDFIKESRPLSPIHFYHFPKSLRKHYEDLAQFPKGLLVGGDALCSFNPIYAQGITISLLEAEVLGSILKDCSKHDLDSENLHRKFFKRVKKILNNSWMTSAIEDLRYPAIEGKRFLFGPLLERYNLELYKLCLRDANVAHALIKVMGLIEPPSSLFSPQIALKVGRSLW